MVGCFPDDATRGEIGSRCREGEIVSAADFSRLGSADNFNARSRFPGCFIIFGELIEIGTDSEDEQPLIR